MVAAVTSANLVPVIVDIRPGLYVLDDRAGAAMVGSTVGMLAPWTFGNAPDLTNLQRLAKAHEVDVWTETWKWTDPAERRFWDLYEVCGEHADWLTLPERLEDQHPAWRAFPLIANDPDKRMGLLMALESEGATIMSANVTEDPRMAEVGAWIKSGALAGAGTAQRGGFVLPLTASPVTVGRILGEAR
jgi:dTDP-4-amino-4,6-dideoxygalactose transaminase